MKCYSVYDASAEYFIPPFFARTDNEAKRMFIGSLGQSFQFRHDFNLFRVASFDQETGVFNAEAAPVIVISGASIPADQGPNEFPVVSAEIPEEFNQPV
ncbi:nonstructural protein [Microviridae sp.]|nr:nonstructural protein [Microviridae sp.]